MGMQNQHPDLVKGSVSVMVVRVAFELSKGDYGLEADELRDCVEGLRELEQVYYEFDE